MRMIQKDSMTEKQKDAYRFEVMMPIVRKLTECGFVTAEDVCNLIHIPVEDAEEYLSVINSVNEKRKEENSRKIQTPL